MTFAAREQSRDQGHPIELYEFRFGPEVGSIRRYCNIANGFTFDGNLYDPMPIQRSEITASGSLDKSAMQVRIPQDAYVATLFTGEPPSSVVTLIIRQGHLADADFKVCWSGKVLGGEFEGKELALECEPISSSLRRSGLTRDYQYTCPLVLYGPQCRANKAAATSTVVVTSVSGVFVTLPSSWATVAKKPKYLGGIAEWVSDGRTHRRSIVNRSGDVLTLSNAPTGLVAGATLTLILGCNHQHGLFDADGDCKNLHNNILNFGGQWEIPLKNPIGVHNNYY